MVMHQLPATAFQRSVQRFFGGIAPVDRCGAQALQLSGIHDEHQSGMPGNAVQGVNQRACRLGIFAQSLPGRWGFWRSLCHGSSPDGHAGQQDSQGQGTTGRMHVMKLQRKIGFYFLCRMK